MAIRYLFKNKLYTFLNIFGLALGIATFIVISLYVSYERSYDTFEGSDQIVRVYMDYAEGGNFSPGDAQTYNLTGPTLKKEFPEIIEQLRLYKLEKAAFVNGNKIIEESNGVLADGSYFNIFNYPIVKGNSAELQRPNTIILNKTLSHKLFGEENPIGKTISVFYSSEVLLEVIAIMEDIPENTHFKTNFLISFETLKTWKALSRQYKPNWNENNFFTYLKVDKNADFNALQQKIIASDFEEDPDERHNIEKLSDIHLYSNKPYEAEANGSISRVRFLSAFAIIVLILSWLNYINLSTAKSLERSMEVGVRKVIGAQKPQLILQSLVESLILNIIAITFAFVILILLLPVFNDFVGKSLSLDLIDISSLMPFLLIIILGTVLSGIYPAFVLSSFSPIKSLKKVKPSSKGISLRKGLITLQFFATVILIIGTIVVANQLNYLRNQPIGAELSQVVALKGEILETQPDSILFNRLKVLKNELENLSFVEKVSNSTTYPGDGYDNLSSTVGIAPPNGIFDERQLFYIYGADPDYFEVLDIPFAAGGSFPEQKLGVTNRNIVINEALAEILGFQNATDIVGDQVTFWNIKWKVSGVIKDYHHFGLKSSIEPLIIAPDTGMDNLLVKLNESTVSYSGLDDMLNQLKGECLNIFPQSTLNFTFLDEKFERQYVEDNKFGIAFQIFTALAILIAMLGLFGLTAFTTMQKRKEIGIRKVSGATVLQILTLINKEFLKWVAIAFVIALPISWYVMNSWLNEYAYKTAIGWEIFLVAGFVVFLIAIVSVSSQAIKAAITNPVNSLRSE
jgi:putative ABC transport system permease protein